MTPPVDHHADERTRAERRRIARELGVRRAAKKKGRRDAVRKVEPPEQPYQHLIAAGFEPVRPRIILPGES